MGSPEDGTDYREFDLEGQRLWVHDDVLLQTEDPGRLKFWFEPLGTCRVRFED